MEVDDDQDEVVQELDVFLSKELIENLFVLQYPITHSKQIFSHSQRFNARVKPVHKKLELEVLLDVNSANYDQSKGEQIALNVNGGVAGEPMTYENSVMDTQVLTSRCVPNLGKRFAAALVQDGQVHVTPISQIVQLQPSFKYMDRAEMKAAQAAKMKAQAESGNSSQDEADDAKAVTVRFKGAETEAARAARERSYAAYEKRLYQERWISASFHHKEDPYAQRERNRLVFNAASSSDTFGDNSLNFTEMSLSSEDFLKTLIPKYTVSDIDSDVTPDNVLSLAKLKSFSLGDQLKMLMKNAKIIHFSHLITLLPSVPDINQIVTLLQSYAVLINGCWIVKSEVLYPSDTVSALTGTSAELMCKVRDYILCLFTKHEYLIRRNIAKQVKISSEEVKIIFEEISKMKVGFGWHLKIPPDPRFNIQFPEVHERQMMLWNARFKQLSKQFNYEANGNDSVQYTDASMKHQLLEGKCGKHSKNKSSTKKSTVSNNVHISSSVSSVESAAVSNCIVDQSQTLIAETIVASNPVKIEKDMDCDFVPMQVFELMDFKPSVEDSNKAETFDSFTNKQNNPGQDNTVQDNTLSSTIPFVIPQAVGVETSFKNTPNGYAPEQTLMPLPPSATGYNSTNDGSNIAGHSSINMENVNSTVALVADQLRQCSNALFSNSEDAPPIIENEIVFHKDITNNCDLSH